MIRLFLILLFTSTLALASDVQPIYIWAKKAGEKISKEIYKPVWQFDSKWTCVFSGNT